MVEMIEPVPFVDDLDAIREEQQMELFPDSIDNLYEPGIDQLSDQLSDDLGSTVLDPSCGSSSSPASPGSAVVENAVPLFPANAMMGQASQVGQTQASQTQEQPKQAEETKVTQTKTTRGRGRGRGVRAGAKVKAESVLNTTTVKHEGPDVSELERPVKREHIEDSPVSSPVASESLPLFPDMLSGSNMTSYLQTLAKGRSEDIEMYRNMLRLHGALTPEIEKQLRHLSRQVKNRESAQISRKRKREYVELLRNAIVRMQSADLSLRSDLSAVQNEATEWQMYARRLQNLLLVHGIEVPSEPAILPHNTVPSYDEPLEDVLPETLFDGPCGFGHMTPPKSLSVSSSTKKHSTRVSPRKQKP